MCNCLCLEILENLDSNTWPLWQYFVEHIRSTRSWLPKMKRNVSWSIYYLTWFRTCQPNRNKSNQRCMMNWILFCYLYYPDMFLILLLNISSFNWYPPSYQKPWLIPIITHLIFWQISIMKRTIYFLLTLHSIIYCSCQYFRM